LDPAYVCSMGTWRYESKKVTVKELKELLDELPSDAKVFYEGGEYKYDYRSVYKVEYNEHATLASTGHSVFIR